LRRGELLALKWIDIDTDPKNLTVRGRASKVGEARHVPLNPKALDVLGKWLTQAAVNKLGVARNG
jgi:integrase